MIGQKQQDTFKRYDDFIKSIANETNCRILWTRYGGLDPKDPI